MSLILFGGGLGGGLGPEFAVSEDRLNAYTMSDGVFVINANANVGITPEGGLVRKLTNDTGALSVKGSVVEACVHRDNAFDLVDVDGNHPIGVVYESGIAALAECWVVWSGRCQVLLQDTTTATRGYWVRVSATAAGRANATLANPPGGAVAQLDAHMQEIGHCLESVTAGTSRLAYIMLHFN